MDTIGSIKDVSMRIKPSKKLDDFINNLEIQDGMPQNIKKYKGIKENNDKSIESVENKSYLNFKDLALIKNILKREESAKAEKIKEFIPKEKDDNEKDNSKHEINDVHYLTISDLEWLSSYLVKLREEGDCIYLHELFEGSDVLLPENEIIKRNPELEERCVKLRRDQSIRDYRSMTKNVDNVRVKQPEETIAYQLKGMNRQLIAIGQFVLSVGAGFLFGFMGIEMMIGRLDFGFRLLLGVMCALIIALAEIYFLAKKLNEDLAIGDTIQLGGPTVYPSKEHKD